MGGLVSQPLGCRLRSGPPKWTTTAASARRDAARSPQEGGETVVQPRGLALGTGPQLPGRFRAPAGLLPGQGGIQVGLASDTMLVDDSGARNATRRRPSGFDGGHLMAARGDQGGRSSGSISLGPPRTTRTSWV